VLGPRQDRFAADALIALVSEPFTVNSASNRIGVRLDGPALQRADTRELLSEGLVAGALQVPGDGQPILLLADHPTTGGYPVVAVVIEADLSLAAQLRPGRELRFSPVR
jgi:allophanate hydrolase subunit 2